MNDENLEPPSEKKMKPLPTMTADDLREIFLDQVTDPIWKEFIEKESQKQYFSTLLTKLAARCQKVGQLKFNVFHDYFFRVIEFDLHSKMSFVLSMSQISIKLRLSSLDKTHILARMMFVLFFSNFS